MYFLLVIAATAVVSNGYAASIPIDLSHPPQNGGRIVGGVKTVIELHPHQVSLHNSSSHLKCGGSIISKDYIVTAGHCVESILNHSTFDSWNIRAGSSFPNHGGSVHEIKQVIRHEDYEASGPYNDVALIQVQQPFVFDDTRQPIKLYHSSKAIRANTMAVVTGFGTIRSKGPLPDQLMTVSIPIVSQKKCNEAYALYGGIHESNICAGDLRKGGKDSCQGDSGGPLTVYGKLAGVVSYGAGCGVPYYPGVYADVSYFYDWIVEKI